MEIVPIKLARWVDERSQIAQFTNALLLNQKVMGGRQIEKNKHIIVKSIHYHSPNRIWLKTNELLKYKLLKIYIFYTYLTFSSF